ncbi:MAG TPA: STAS domain-containing protein [Geobacteraceae bacterium]|nr:STAS domain-containing protein [Geobacteraceae bacterium]
MEIAVTENSGVTILTPMNERLDAHNSDTMKGAMKESFEAGAKNVLVDLSHVRFIDSSGLGALVSGFKNSVSHRGRLTLSGLQEQVRSMFELTRLHRVFEIHEGLQDALASFSEGDVHG